MRTIRVTQLEQFRIWRDDEDLDTGWLLTRLLGKEEPSDVMLAGTAFHGALERAREEELEVLESGKYRFEFNCDSEVQLPTIRELEVRKQYGNIMVVGHVDGLTGKEVVDYKTTGQFDPDRYMSSYQWRLYLDMLECSRFRWEIFVIAQFGAPYCYEVKQTNRLIQYAYPDMRRDCEELVSDFSEFASSYPNLFADEKVNT